MYIYSYINHLIYHFWFSSFCSCGFRFPSDIVSLCQHSFVPTHLLCAVIGKYINILHYRECIIHIYIISYSCFLNMLREERRKVCISSVFYNDVITFIDVLSFSMWTQITIWGYPAFTLKYFLEYFL